MEVNKKCSQFLKEFLRLLSCMTKEHLAVSTQQEKQKKQKAGG
ncbi:hypothetical protein [Metabacillus lacus]|nr:hypothetical protein [Metabacillus lacus]